MASTTLGQTQAFVAPHMKMVGHGQRSNGVHRPGRNAPVEERIGNAVFQRFGARGGNTQAWRQVVITPLHECPIHGCRTQPCADEHEYPTGGEYCGRPSPKRMLPYLLKASAKVINTEKKPSNWTQEPNACVAALNACSANTLDRSGNAVRHPTGQFDIDANTQCKSYENC